MPHILFTLDYSQVGNIPVIEKSKQKYNVLSHRTRKQSCQSRYVHLGIYPPTFSQGMDIPVYMTDEVLAVLWEDKIDTERLTTQTVNYWEMRATN